MSNPEPVLPAENPVPHWKFKALLEEEYVWPTDFHFKFIVPVAQVDALQGLLNTTARIVVKLSRNNRYASVSARMKMSSSDEVVYVYELVSGIEGIIAL
ncbi:MAG: DUF493 domain-containing protein [Candidatus Sericytochromatia bacterium]